MEKISIKLDLAKVDKSRIVPRSFQTKEGEEVVAKEYAISVVPLKEPKLIKEGATWKMWKKYFVVEEHSKEEREGGKKDVFLGDGIVFESIGGTQSTGTDEEVPF